MFITKDDGKQYWTLWEYCPMKNKDGKWENGGSHMLIGWNELDTIYHEGLSYPLEVGLYLYDMDTKPNNIK